MQVLKNPDVEELLITRHQDAILCLQHVLIPAYESALTALSESGQLNTMAFDETSSTLVTTSLPDLPTFNALEDALDCVRPYVDLKILVPGTTKQLTPDLLFQEIRTTCHFLTVKIFVKVMEFTIPNAKYSKRVIFVRAQKLRWWLRKTLEDSRKQIQLTCSRYESEFVSVLKTKCKIENLNKHFDSLWLHLVSIINTDSLHKVCNEATPYYIVLDLCLSACIKFMMPTLMRVSAFVIDFWFDRKSLPKASKTPLALNTAVAWMQDCFVMSLLLLRLEIEEKRFRPLSAYSKKSYQWSLSENPNVRREEIKMRELLQVCIRNFVIWFFNEKTKLVTRNFLVGTLEVNRDDQFRCDYFATIHKTQEDVACVFAWGQVLLNYRDSKERKMSNAPQSFIGKRPPHWELRTQIPSNILLPGQTKGTFPSWISIMQLQSMKLRGKKQREASKPTEDTVSQKSNFNRRRPQFPWWILYIIRWAARARRNKAKQDDL